MQLKLYGKLAFSRFLIVLRNQRGLRIDARTLPKTPNINPYSVEHEIMNFEGQMWRRRNTGRQTFDLNVEHFIPTILQARWKLVL